MAEEQEEAERERQRHVLLDAVGRGLDAMAYREHPFAKLLMSFADDMAAVAAEELRSVDPRDAMRIAQLQWAANMPAKINEWIDSVIDLGRVAEHQLSVDEADPQD